MIARWRAGAPQDEPDALSDGDWMWLCQEWDSHNFSATILSKRAHGSAVKLSVRLNIGYGERRNAQLVLKREGGRWKLDDLISSPDFPRWLRQKLRETHAENSVP